MVLGLSTSLNVRSDGGPMVVPRVDAKPNHPRARDLFYGLWVPDLFMERVKADADWTLFCPNESYDEDTGKGATGEAASWGSCGAGCCYWGSWQQLQLGFEFAWQGRGSNWVL